MPTKKNFLGGQQNYNKETGEYESSLVGPGGNVVKDADGDGKEHEGKKKTTHTWKSGKQSEIEYYEKAPEGYKELKGALTAPNGYRWYSNGKSYFDKDRDTVLVKDQEWFGDEKDFNDPTELESKRVERDFDVEHDEDYERSWGPQDDDEEPQPSGYIDDADKVALVPDLIDKGYSSDEAHNILFEARDEIVKSGKDVDYKTLKEYIDKKQPKAAKEEHKPNEFKLDKEKYPDVEETPYGFIYNAYGHSITDVAGQNKAFGEFVDPNKNYGFHLEVGGDESYYDSFDEAYNRAKELSQPKAATEKDEKYPKGTSKEYTEEINKKYSGAVDILKKAGIKTDYKNYEEISKAQDEIMSKWEESKDDAKYKPIYEALEIVEDKIYNDDYIRLAPYGY